MPSVSARSPAAAAAPTALAALVLSVAMFAFGYAMVPLYYRLCAALGIDTAKPWVLKSAAAQAAPRALRVEFDANSHNELVAMTPAARVTELNTGTAYSLTYRIENLTDRPLVGLAVPSYSPARAASWISKLQCFCFEQLELAPREVRRDPVVFALGRELPGDIETVALSYTFFPAEAPPHAHAPGAAPH